MIISYKPLLSRQSIISEKKVYKMNITKINSDTFVCYKNQTFHYIILNSEPKYLYMFNVKFNKNNLYGHSSFPQIDNHIYNKELNQIDLKFEHNYQVKYSGNISFNSDGKLKYWNNSSGHYQPHAIHSKYVKLDNSKFKPHNIKISWADKVTINK